jgi:HEPN domain-containing protein
VYTALPVRHEVLLWLEEARADLRHAAKSIDIGDYNWACFAAQQAAEKALKALIMHVVGEYPRGHDLVRLYDVASRYVRLNLSRTLLSRLSAFYTQARYPNAGLERPWEEITIEQAREAVEVAGKVLSEVEKALRDP